MIDYKQSLEDSPIPHYMHGGIIRWIEHGYTPGGFLQAFLRNDLHGALASADAVNLPRIHEYLAWFVKYAPALCWGSSENVEAWARLKEKERDAE